jgi:hypothetical protein
MARETPQALQAFEDYWAMGDGRSLKKLWALYRQRRGNGEGVPTAKLRTLGEWSTVHGWQDRVAARVSEEAELARKRHRERIERQRERYLVGIEAGTAKFLQALDRGEVVLIESGADLTTTGKFYFQVAGEPLADRQELTGAGGGPMQVQVEHDATAVLSDPHLRALAAELVGRASSGPPEPGESGDTPEPRDLADGAAPEAAQ